MPFPQKTARFFPGEASRSEIIIYLPDANVQIAAACDRVISVVRRADMCYDMIKTMVQNTLREVKECNCLNRSP